MSGEHEIVFARLDGEIAHRHRRETAAFELRPGLAAIDRDKKSKLGPEKQQIRLHDIFLDDVGVSANTFGVLRASTSGSPGLADSQSCGKRRARYRRRYGDRKRRRRCRRRSYWPAPSCTQEFWRKAGNVANDVVPGLRAIARDLQVAIVRPDPDDILVLGRFADRVNRGVHFRRRIVDGDAARLFLFLFLRIVRRQVGRNALPGLAMIARAKEKLRADIDRPFLVRRNGHRRIPVPAQLFLVVRLAAECRALRGYGD